MYRGYLFSLGHELGWATPNHNVIFELISLFLFVMILVHGSYRSLWQYLIGKRQPGTKPLIISMLDYSKTSNVSNTLVGIKIVDHSDVVGALPAGTAPTTSSFFT